MNLAEWSDFGVLLRFTCCSKSVLDTAKVKHYAGDAFPLRGEGRNDPDPPAVVHDSLWWFPGIDCQPRTSS